MSDNKKTLTVKDALYRTAEDLSSGALWTSQAIASIAELTGISKRCTHSQALIALTNKLDEENELAYEQVLRVGAGITALKAAYILAKGHGWPEPDDLIRINLERCARPAPDYVGADSEPFHALDTVWDVETHEEGTVDDIDANGVHVHWVNMTLGECYVDPERLTHEMPFLAADGVPLKVFEPVFDTETGIAYVVAELPMPGACDKVRLYRCGAEDSFSEYFELSRLTHTQPNAKEGE